LDEHEEHLRRYDEERQRRESETAAETDRFVEQLRPYVGLKIENLIVEPNQQKKSDPFELYKDYDSRVFKNNLQLLKYEVGTYLIYCRVKSNANGTKTLQIQTLARFFNY
jgi:hypothetical protein